MIIREAIHSDRDSIVGFQLAMAHETENIELDIKKVRNGAQAVFDEPARGRYFVAEIDGQVVASLLITYEWSEWRNGVVWWIQSVYVKPEFRNRGIYKGMYAHVKERVLQDPSIMGIRLYVDETNTSAQDVYRRLGMDGDHYRVYEWMKD